MRAIMRRMEQGERCWAGEVVLRAFGLAMLGICACAACWTFRSVNHAPHHPATPLEMGGAALAVMGWSLGGAFLAEGPGLFRLIWLPARHWPIEGEKP